MSKSIFTKNDIIQIREKPHLLGHLAGKDKLTELHSKWIKYMWETTEERCLRAHRNSYKTTSVIIIGCIWWLFFHPDDRIGIIRKSFTDASAVTTTIRNLFKKPIIREFFKFGFGFYPDFRIQQNGKIEFVFKNTITPEGSINAYGIESGYTGTHLDRILCDDFVTIKDRLSEAERKRTIENIKEIRTNIIESGKSVGFMGTPWHKNDAWSILPKPLDFDVYTTGILNKEQIEDKKNKTTPQLFTINYELRHTADEGLLFANPRYREKWISHTRGTVCHLDAGFSGSNTCALTFMCPFKSKEGIIQAIGKNYSGHVDNWMNFIEAEYRIRNCTKIYIETNADKGYVAKELKKRKLNVIEYNESQNKHIKISTYLYKKWQYIEWIKNETDDEYLIQITDYQEGNDYDDAPDSAASLIRAEFYDGDQSYMALYMD